MIAVAVGAALVCLPVFARLAARTSKRRSYSRSMLVAAATFPLLGLAGLLPGIPAELQILVATALIAAPVGAHYLFPVPLTADVADDDSARTGQRREATYLGAASFVERATASISPLVLVLLRLLGDTRGHSLGVHLVGPVAGLVGFLLFRRFDLAERHQAAGRPAPVLTPVPAAATAT